MASHQLAIAKASFSAGLLRPDPTSLSRDDIAHFNALLNAAVVRCTPRNVQKCKHWILENIVQSVARFTALGKYLTALATSFSDSSAVPASSAAPREPSTRRKRMHLLYLVNDILHHAKYLANDASICSKIQPMLVSLFGSAASFKDCPKHHQKIVDLLDIWETKSYYSKDYIEKLREAVKNASEQVESSTEDGARQPGTAEQDSTMKAAKAAPYVMPAMHGDSSTPWFDLPAGNLMPHIIPNSTRPMNPDMIKPLQFVAGPADEGLVVAVKALLDEVQTIFGTEANQDEKVPWDIDELGQLIILDDVTGDVIGGEGYYGWSREFCERMNRRRKGLDMSDHDEGRGRSSRSLSSSRGRRKRQYSQSVDESSRSDQDRPRRTRKSYSSSRSRSPSRSPTPDHDRRLQRNGHRPEPRNRSYSRSPYVSPSRAQRSQDSYSTEAATLSNPRNRVDGPPMQPVFPMNMPVPFQPPFNSNFPPPPPHTLPRNDSGGQFPTWPPPPPPMQFNPGNGQMGSWPPPPPPPPPPPNTGFNFQQHQGGFPPSDAGGWQAQMQPGDGRGYNHKSWNQSSSGFQGRGGRGGYRGRGGWS